MFTIIGGTYRETCVSPHWDQIYGSGLRAAAACVQLAEAHKDQITICTWAADTEINEVQSRADTYGVESSIRLRKDAIEFRYEHPLAQPTIYPPPNSIMPIDNEHLSCDAALAFGLLEGDYSVSANRLVYDPQSGHKAAPLSKTLLKGKDACIVANLTEARAMLAGLGANESAFSLTASDAARELLKKERVSAVVVKNGIYGASVASGDNIELCPCFKTEEVFSIGSGDVFTAIFAYLWAIEGESPVAASIKASQATAYYCNSRSLPIPADIAKAADMFPALPVERRERSRQVYLAGPLFNLPERWFVEETVRCLKNFGLHVFSPMHEVGYSSDMKYVATADLKGLDDSDIVFAILDGLDAGTVYEIGYAAAKGKHVIAYGERVTNSDLTMLSGTGTQFFRDYATAIHHVAWAATNP